MRLIALAAMLAAPCAQSTPERTATLHANTFRVAAALAGP